jgi:hypothetical protein
MNEPAVLIPAVLRPWIFINTEFKQLICKDCQYAIRPTELASHLFKMHRKRKSLSIKELIQQWNWMDAPKMTMPEDGSAPLPHVRIVKMHKCQECPFISKNLLDIYNHFSHTGHTGVTTGPVQSWYGEHDTSGWSIVVGLGGRELLGARSVRTISRGMWDEEPVEEAATEEPAIEAPAEEPPAEESPATEEPAIEAPAEEPPAEASLAGEPVEEAAPEAPSGEVLAEEPVEATAEEAPEEAPAEEALAEEPEEAITEEAPAEEMPAEEMPEDVPAEELDNKVFGEDEDGYIII